MPALCFASFFASQFNLYFYLVLFLPSLAFVACFAVVTCVFVCVFSWLLVPDVGMIGRLTGARFVVRSRVRLFRSLADWLLDWLTAWLVVEVGLFPSKLTLSTASSVVCWCFFLSSPSAL